MALFRKTAFLPAFLLCLAGGAAAAGAQEPASKPAVKADEPTAAQKENPASKPELPFQIQLLETQIRFEGSGDSRKEVHTVVKINNILGAHQFARLAFDYNRAFQQIEIPLVRINHANGGTSEVLPSAVVDAPNPAVEQFPAYQDVRVKSVRILGLQEGDTIEYRVITTTTKHPLAPDFWVEHTFDRSGQVLEEHYQLDLPAPRNAEIRISPAAPPSSQERIGNAESARLLYQWTRIYSEPKRDASHTELKPEPETNADVAVSTLSWEFLAIRLAELMLPGSQPIAQAKTYEESAKEMSRQPEVTEPVREKAAALTRDAKSDLERLKKIYDFVSTKIVTVDLPLDATGFRARDAEAVLKSGYGTGEDKFVLFAMLAAAVHNQVAPALTGFCDKTAPAVPGVFKHLVVIASTKERQYWLDPALEVAPFGMITPMPAKCALVLNRVFFAMNSPGHEWVNIPTSLPFAAFQTVSVNAAVTGAGQLSAKVRYTLRGDNELLLRVAFHQTPKEKWKDVAGLLALSDGFRGQVTSVNASDPAATKDPFTVEYELTQEKFVDWSKKPVRIPALLPQIGLPDLPTGLAPGKIAPKIELGTPLDVQTSMTLRLPKGTTAQTPAGTTAARDYATYASKYSSTMNTVVASRHIHFLKREIPGDRAVDYNAFIQAVQTDQAQRFTILPAADADVAGKPAQLPAKP